MGAVYTQLSMQERRRIEDWWHAKVPVAEMARQVNRHRATVSREIKRNFWADDAFPKKYAGYFGMAAHQRTQRKLIRYPELRQRILSHLKDGWTPEQIGNRMIFDGVKHRACQETIYRYIYSKEGMAQELWWYLPLHRKNRTPHHAALASVKSPSLTVMSAFFSARMMSPTGVSLGIGRAI
jgi:IS30 family transposase